MRALGDGAWMVDHPFSLGGIQLGNRMAVLGLEGGGLLLYSPVPIDDELAARIDAVGEVQHLVAPNLLHHLHLPQVQARYPEATLHAPEGLGKKQPGLRIDRPLGSEAPATWGEAIECLPFEGAPALRETALLHRPSRTLVCADLLFHFREARGLLTRLYLRANGALGRPAQTRLLRTAIRDRAAARTSIDHMLTRDFDRLVPAHGQPIEQGGREALRDATDWLRA